MTASEYADARAAALRIAAAAHQITRFVQRGGTAATAAAGPGGADDPVTSASKPDASPVTVADYAVQTFITLRLAALFPGDAFIAEETSAALRTSPELLAQVIAAVRVGLDAVRADAGPDVGADEVLAAIDRADCVGGDGRRTWM
jgi:3'-phosphoadenosine 5'-phosphosulfate (PAPS) 3'-phosphatase